MKNIKYFAIVAAFLVLPFLSSAQQHKAKFGHINYGEVIQLMQGIDSIQKIIIDFQTELQVVGEEMANEFKKKQEEYQVLASTSPSATVLKIKEDELRAMYARIEEYSQTMETDLQNKQLELLKPFQDQLLATIKEVALAENFTYIFDTSTLSYYAQGEDITAKVKLKLNITQ